MHGASAGFLAPAGRPGAIARLLPARPRSPPAVVPRAAAALQRAPCSNAGTATQTPARPCPPRCRIPHQQGPRDREGTGQWHRWGQWEGHGAGGCQAAGHGPCLQKVFASSRVLGSAMPGGCPGPWRCPSPGDASGPSHRGKPGCSTLPRASASSCHGAEPRHHKAPAPRCPPREGCPLRGVTCQTGQGMGWGGCGSARDGQPHEGWHQGHRVVGCSPPSRSRGCGEAQEEPSGEGRGLLCSSCAVFP